MLKNQPFLRFSGTIVFVAALALTANALASAPVEQVLHSFMGGTDGNNPDGGLVADVPHKDF